MDGPFWERLSEAMAGQKTTACTRGRQAWWGSCGRRSIEKALTGLLYPVEIEVVIESVRGEGRYGLEMR